MKTLTTALIALVCLVGSDPEPGLEGEIQLRAVKMPAARWHCATVVQLDSRGTGSIEFPTESGRLLLHASDGVVQFDTNCDGVIDGEDAPAVKQDEFCSIPVATAGRDFDYQITPYLVNSEYVMLQGATVLGAIVDGMKVALIDANLNGSFDEARLDSITVARNTNRPELVIRPVRQADMIVIDGLLHRLRVRDDGFTITLTQFDEQTASLDRW